MPFQAQAQIADENGCVRINGQRVPEDFVSDLENGIFFDIALQEHIKKDTEAEPKGVWYQSSIPWVEYQAPEWVLTIPDLNDRIEQWRVINRMSPAFEEECGLNPQPSEKDIDSSLSNTDSTAVLQNQSGDLEQITGTVGLAGTARSSLKPQHSVANIIFKRKTIQLQIYDYKYADRDTVDIYWNGIPLKYGHVLLPYPGTTFILNLAPSAILAAKNHFPANTLVFFGRAGSFFFGINTEPGVTLAVKVKNPATIFPGGPFRDPGKPLKLDFAKNFPRLPPVSG